MHGAQAGREGESGRERERETGRCACNEKGKSAPPWSLGSAGTVPAILPSCLRCACVLACLLAGDAPPTRPPLRHSHSPCPAKTGQGVPAGGGDASAQLGTLRIWEGSGNGKARPSICAVCAQQWPSERGAGGGGAWRRGPGAGVPHDGRTSDERWLLCPARPAQRALVGRVQPGKRRVAAMQPSEAHGGRTRTRRRRRWRQRLWRRP